MTEDNRTPEYVAKDLVRVRIDTVCERIDGVVHVALRHRPSDLLNDATRFIAVTDASVFAPGARIPRLQVPFISINKDHIVSLREL